MSETLVWWLLLQVVGLAALPLCLTLFRRLPDRGYTLSKAFALILIGYLLWVLNVARILPNETGGIWIIILLLFGASALLFVRRRDELLAFARERWWLIAATEVVLFLSFITAAYLRSYVADIGGTEKPMDFMFLNAVTRAERFPPPDAWLAGENVAYYYFGYLIVSVMTRLSALETSVGFNLGLAMTVALGVTGAFGLVYNMTSPREQRAAEAGPGTAARGVSGRVLWRPMVFGLAAAVLLAVIGNLGGLFEALAQRGIGSQGFWSWVGISGLEPYESSRWYPDQHWFWWRSTRILDGGVGIHEFPFFSFLLGDLHPHVMSIPFVLLAVGVAQALLRSDEPLDLVVWLERPLALAALAIVLGGLAFLNTWDMPTMALLIAVVALVRNRLLAERWSWGLALDTAGFLLPLYVAAMLAYVPFFFGGFDSQASGFRAVTSAGSGLFHTLILWGPFAAIVLPYAAWRLLRGGRLTAGPIAWSLAPAAALLLLWLFWDLLAGPQAGSQSPARFGIDRLLGWLPPAVRPIDSHVGTGNALSDVIDSIGNRGWNWLTFFVLAATLGLVAQAFFREVEDAKRAAEERFGHIMALALAGTAALLILGSEFFFILDTFGSRMNTIFKLYYQAWLLLSVAGGFALYQLARDVRLPAIGLPKSATVAVSLGGGSLVELGVLGATVVGAIIGIALGQDGLTRIIGAVVGGGLFYVTAVAGVLLWRVTEPKKEGDAPIPAARHGSALVSWRAAWAGATVVVLFAAFLYPLLATYNRTNSFNVPLRTLDGLAHLPPDERVIIKYLAGLDGHPVVVEAQGGDYSEFGRISAATGLPTIIQWPGHELQWRGSGEGLTEREEAVDALYTSAAPDEVRRLLQEYGVQYVIVGRMERQEYPEGIAIADMTELVEVARQEGEVTVYRVRPGILTEASR